MARMGHRSPCHDVRVRLAAENGKPPPEPFSLPEPDEPLVSCPECRGVGTVSEAAAVEAGRTGGGSLIERKVAVLKARAAVEAREDPPALRVVD
jgi:hypothetical protein